MTHREKAIAWMRKYPEVLTMFEKFGEQIVERGRRFGFHFLTERVRWESTFHYDEEFKISNNHSAYIARRMLYKHPHWGKFIKTNRVADEVDSIRLITDEDLLIPQQAAA